MYTLVLTYEQYDKVWQAYDDWLWEEDGEKYGTGREESFEQWFAKTQDASIHHTCDWGENGANRGMRDADWRYVARFHSEKHATAFLLRWG